MRIVDEYYSESFYTSKVFERYFGEARLAVFDIETSGLSPGRSKIVIGGVLTPDVNGVRLRQFFSEGAHEETELLALYTDVLRGADVVFSYNGDGFDIPFVNSRLKARNREGAFADCLSIDLYKVVRSFTDIRSKLPNLKQKTVEDYLGLWKSRTDRISGADSVTLYYEYLATRSPELLQFLLLHNSDDVLQLARVLRVFDEVDMHAMAFQIGFPVIHDEARLLVKSLKLQGNVLEVSGHCASLPRHPMDYAFYGEAFQAFFHEDDGSFKVRIPCVNAEGIIAADLTELRVEHPSFEGALAAKSGFLPLKRRSQVNYEMINLLAELAIRKILDSI